MTERNTTESLKEFLGTFKRRMPKDVFIDMEAALSDIFHEIQKSENERIRKSLINLFKIENFNGYTTLNGIDVDDVITWLEKQGEQETDEWKEGNIIRHGGILALVIKGRRAMKSNGEIFTVQYPDEWVKAAPNEIEHFLNEFEKQGEQKPKWTEEDDIIRFELIKRMEALDHYWNRPTDQKLIDWIKSIKQRMEG